MINEAKLTMALMKTLREELPGYVIIKHHDPITAGVPDISVTGRGKTTWLEVKYANPHIIDRGIQAEMMKKLHTAGSAYYVVYMEQKSMTTIRRPGLALSDTTGLVAAWEGFNHKGVVGFIKGLHS